MVEAFAAMHPGLEPHFTANEGYGHDHRWDDFFHLMGGAPSGLCNMYLFHGLFAGAVKEGCDLLLLAEWGNYTFSDKGDWGFVEYLLKGRWRQLWLAIARQQNQHEPFWWRFAARSLLALLPSPLWRLVLRVAQPGRHLLADLMQPLSASYRADVRRRSAAGGLRVDHRSISAAGTGVMPMRLLFQNNDAETAEVYQAFEQMYDLPQRDPMAYRPFVEFCFGLPVEMFLRDGTMRWLAKQMAKGIMPEEQRTNLLHGRWDSDWLLRIRRRRCRLSGRN